MSAPAIKISFSAATGRVRGEFSLAEAQNSPTPPDDFWSRIQTKLSSESNNGRIADFVLLKEQFVAAWKAAVVCKTEASDLVISVTLAMAHPKMDGVEFKPSDGNSTCSVHASVASGVAKKWSFEWFEAAATIAAKVYATNQRIHSAVLKSMFTRMQLGIKIDGEGLPAAPPSVVDKPFQLMASATKVEICAVIHDVKVIKNPKALDGFLKIANDAAEKLKAGTGNPYQILKPEIQAQLAAAATGAERLGLNLPLMILVGMQEFSPVESSGSQGASTASSQDLSKRNLIKGNYPGKDRLVVVISDDGMSANVGQWDMALYEEKTFQVSVDWIEKEAKNWGITNNYGECVKEMKEPISKKKDITGRQIAFGSAGEGGTEPYLHPVYQEAKVQRESNSAEELRNSQQKQIVKVGQLLAEIRYGHEGTMGKNVFGVDVPPPPPSDMEVQVGEGVRRDGSKFYSLREGKPEIEGNKIMVSDALVLNDDVNLRTGNVYFGGNVEIKGSIDSGATVEVIGDLTVHGTIRGAFVRVGGKLTVKQGINTGGRGMVRVRSDIDAEFIENSTVACGGNLTVKRVIMNSRVVAGGSIVVDKEQGVIAGGMVSGRISIETGRLGLPKGQKTMISVGVDWRQELSLQIRQTRLANLTAKIESVRADLREVTRKKKVTKLPKLEELSLQLADYLQRGRVVTDKLEKSIKDATARISYDPDAKIVVHETLCSNVDLTCAGNKVAILKDVAGVEVNAQRRGGSFVHAIKSDKREAS
jgi:uncharacterized protein (DUF342 family)